MYLKTATWRIFEYVVNVSGDLERILFKVNEGKVTQVVKKIPFM